MKTYGNNTINWDETT